MALARRAWRPSCEHIWPYIEHGPGKERSANACCTALGAQPQRLAIKDAGAAELRGAQGQHVDDCRQHGWQGVHRAQRAGAQLGRLGMSGF